MQAQNISRLLWLNFVNNLWKEIWFFIETVDKCFYETPSGEVWTSVPMDKDEEDNTIKDEKGRVVPKYLGIKSFHTCGIVISQYTQRDIGN